MTNNLKINSSRSQLALFLMLMGAAWILVLFISGAVLLLVQGKEAILKGKTDLSDPHLTGVLKLLQGLSSILLFLVPALLFGRLTFREKSLYYTGFRKVNNNSMYLLAVALLFFSFPLEGWLGQVNKAIPLPEWMIHMEKEADKQVSLFFRTRSIYDTLVNLFIIAFLPAICEEACFRGMLQRILIRAFKSPWAGIIVTAAFFSAFHMQFQGFLPRMFLGVLLGAIYWYSDSLWPSILAHFFTNGIQVVAVAFYPRLINDNPAVPAYAALISLIIVVGLLYGMRRRSKVSYAGIFGRENSGLQEGLPG